MANFQTNLNYLDVKAVPLNKVPQKKNRSRFFSSLGPGILFACVTAGGANFVQATHVGAEYGLKLIPFILLIYLLKYPFFELATRYGATTQQTLLDGYSKMGPMALILYLIVISCTAFPTIAALTLVDANLTAFFFHSTISPLIISIALLGLCTIILIFGKYPFLATTVKIIIGLLILCSLITVFIALPEGIHVLQKPSTNPSLIAEFTVFVVLMGWMPAPIDVSVWTTLWSRARVKATQTVPSITEELRDFNIGYLISALLIVIFIALGAFVMYASDQRFSTSGYLFVEQLVTLFTTHIGSWGEPFILIIIFSVLYSATLVCLDAYPRAFAQALVLLRPNYKPLINLIYWLSVIFLFFISVILSGYFLKSMKQLVDLATLLAFLTAPILGYLNYRVATSKEIPSTATPPKPLLWLCKIGLLFLAIISILFIIERAFSIDLSEFAFHL